ncbi:MAG: 6-hydroxymethylpterin diphosphokinase MptE-like protein [Thermodesulfobacteriota bacterium]|nr:6-hydroxymethylpterin diphosphokinase MptE-like protein [Thermodesulfobacteriota bacterium]
MELYQFLEKNLKALKKQNSTVLAWLDSQDFDPRALEDRLMVNRWGFLDIPVGDDGQTMFEAMPPGAYYQGWTKPDKPETGATVLVGCNLGYGLNHILTNTPNSHKVIVLEPRPEILTLCLGQTDYSPFMEMRKLFFIPPKKKALENTIHQIDLQLIHGSVNLRSDVPSRQIGPEYAFWTRQFKEKLENFTVELNTLRKKQDVMVGNELKNFSQAFENGSISRLEGKAKGLSAVILGAGPSLDTFGPQLAENPGHALYATALQTLPALKALGLKPHLCMAIDYSPGLLSVFKRLDKDWARDIPLIYSTKVLPKVVEDYPGPTVPLWTVGGLATFMMQNSEFVLDAGGSVSVTLLRFLTWCGANQILLVGQDFAWSGESSHVQGHHASKKAFKFDPKRHVELKNAHGQTVYSAMPYVTALRDMEKDIREMDVPVFNLYGDGLEIQGTRTVTLEKVRMNGIIASVPGAMQSFEEALRSAVHPRTRPIFEPRAAQWTSSLRAVTRRLEKLFKKPEKNQGSIHQAFGQVFTYFRQDPLYAPYLFNEIMDMAGLTHAKSGHARKELVDFKKIAKRALAKVREIDCIVGPKKDEKAA